MSTTKVLIFADSSILIQLLSLTREDTSALITGGVVVEGSVYLSGAETPLATVALAHFGSGNWQGTVAPEAVNLAKDDLVDVKWHVTDGAGLTGTWWARERKVRENRPEDLF